MTQDTNEQVDLWDAELFRDGPPHEVFDRVRAEAPLYWSAHADDPDGGFWSLTRHEDIQAISRDHVRFTSTAGQTVPRLTEVGLFAENIMFRDPPAHTAHRKPLNRAFTPKAMMELEDMVRTVVARVLDDLDSRATFDWVPEVAAEIPARVV